VSFAGDRQSNLRKFDDGDESMGRLKTIVFDCIKEHGPQTDEEIQERLGMGRGGAVFTSAERRTLNAGAHRVQFSRHSRGDLRGGYMDLHSLLAERRRIAEHFCSMFTRLVMLRGQLVAAFADEDREYVRYAIEEEILMVRELEEKLLQLDEAILQAVSEVEWREMKRAAPPRRARPTTKRPPLRGHVRV
jgi:hypothetical protein